MEALTQLIKNRILELELMIAELDKKEFIYDVIIRRKLWNLKNTLGVNKELLHSIEGRLTKH